MRKRRRKSIKSRKISGLKLKWRKNQKFKRGTKKNQKSPSPIQSYKPPAPYPERLKKQEHDQQFAKFLERFKTLHINMPLMEYLSQMLKYAKFLKELIFNKKKLQEF